MIDKPRWPMNLQNGLKTVDKVISSTTTVLGLALSFMATPGTIFNEFTNGVLTGVESRVLAAGLTLCSYGALRLLNVPHILSKALQKHQKKDRQFSM